MVHLHIRISGRPVTWNTFYAGKHWSQRKRLGDEWKIRALAAINESGFNGALSHAYVGVRLNIRGRAHVPDASNVWFKAVEDAVVSAGILPDDGPDYVRGVFVTVRTGQPADMLEFVLADTAADVLEAFGVE